jgi:hypothetical protein
MADKLTPYEIGSKTDVERGETVENRVKDSRGAIRKRLSRDSRQGRFLRKYGSDTVLEAVKKESSAATEFMDHVSRFRKFGSLSNLEIRGVIEEAIHQRDAAQRLIVNARRFVDFFGESELQDLLLRVVVTHKGLQGDLLGLLRQEERDQERAAKRNKGQGSSSPQGLPWATELKIKILTLKGLQSQHEISPQKYPV